jgi:hypothetical protein
MLLLGKENILNVRLFKDLVTFPCLSNKTNVPKYLMFVVALVAVASVPIGAELVVLGQIQQDAEGKCTPGGVAFNASKGRCISGGPQAEETEGADEEVEDDE